LRHPRTLRRVVLVAYGEPGAEWLRAAAGSMRHHPLLQQLLDASMVQLWVVGAERPAEHPPLLRFVAADPQPPRLRGMLEEGARAQNRAQFPAIEMHSILVLDRWSLFDKPTAHRTSLRKALDTACRTSCHEAGAPEFDYEWISLADTTRPATNPDDDTVQVVRHLLLDDSFPDRVLLIDRKDAGNAVIERPLADTSFLQVATAILTNEILGRAVVIGKVPGREAGIDVPQDMVVQAWSYMHRHYLDEMVRDMRKDDCCWEWVTLLNFVLMTLREVRQGEAMEYAYHLRLKKSDERVALVRELEAVAGIDGVTLYYQDAASEL